MFTVIPNNSEQNKRTIFMQDEIVGSCIQHKGGLIVSCCTLFHNFKLFKYKNKVIHTSVFPMQWKAKMKSPCSNINHKRELLNTGCDFSSSNDLRVRHFIFCVAWLSHNRKTTSDEHNYKQLQFFSLFYVRSLSDA